MNKIEKIILIPANILLFFAMIFFMVALLGPKADGEAYIGDFGTESFNEGWILQVKEEEQEIDLPYIVLSEGAEEITLRNTLPEYVENGMRLCMRSSRCDVSIYVGDELRENYVLDNFSHLGSNLPSAYLMVDLAEEDAGKEIRICMTSNDTNKIREMSIGYGNNAWFALLARNLPVAVAAVLLCCIGALVIIAHWAMRGVFQDRNSLLYLGQVMLLVGLWIISESNLRQLIFHSAVYSKWFTYIFLEVLSGFVVLYFNEVQNHQYKKAYVIVAALAFGQALVNTLLACFNIADYHDTLIFSHFWMVVSLIICLGTLLLDMKTKRIKRYVIVAVGMLSFFVFFVIEIINYYSKSYYSLGVYVCIGLIVLLMTTVIQTISEELEKVRKSAQLAEFQSELEAKVNEQTHELQMQQKQMRELLVQTVTALSDAVDAKDRYTSGHSKRVAKYACMIAERMGKSKEEQEEIYQTGLLHDVGKIRIPADIINKPGKLTEEEYDIIKIHPVTGYNILSSIANHNSIAIGAKYHHERYDGTGYPNGLAGNNIPEVARILGVADSYDAMASNRSYRDALPQMVIRREIERGKGTQFDPEIADIMLRIIDEDRNYTLKQSDSALKRVLTVDDEAMNNKIIAHIMKDEPLYHIVSATGGMEALEILEEQTFDLILLDVRMPGMDGIETLKKIREKYQTPIVLMTSEKTLTISEQFSKFGCDDYITKPFSPVLVKEIIYNLTNKTKLEEDIKTQ